MSKTTDKKEVRYPFRDLKNYKAMHAEVAKAKGVYEQLMACKTLTAARRVVFG